MIRFNSDYLEGAHQRIIDKLVETNMVQSVGYGEDEYCDQARAMIRKLCNAPKADVHLLVGGTQTNFTFLAAAMRCYQGVIAAETGHIAVHETGAVEATGHKVIALPHKNGKICAGQVSEYCRLHFSDASHEHIVMPKVVYISQSTELGTIYTREELIAMRGVCDQWNLYLYIDGARMGYGLCSEGCDVDLPFIAEIADAFYIGGTKQGILFGEALVIINEELKKDFRYVHKQKGGMLAKGRLLGVQFCELMKDDLYFELSRHAVGLAMKMKKAMLDMGVEFLVDSPSNQQFPILADSVIEALSKNYGFSYQERVDAGRSAVRFCTSWASTEEQVDALIQDIGVLLKA